MLVLTAAVGVTFFKNTSKDKNEEIRRSVNVALIKENIASSALYIYAYLSGELRAMEDNNADITFKRILGVDLIACASRVTVGEGKRLKEDLRTTENNTFQQ